MKYILGSILTVVLVMSATVWSGHVYDSGGASYFPGGVAVGNVDVDGWNIILDTDGDTYIENDRGAPGDDEFSFVINGGADVTFSANQVLFESGTTLHMNENDIKNVDDILYYAPASDTTPGTISIHSAHTYSKASSKVNGAPLYLYGGVGTNEVTIDDWNNCVGNTVTVTINDTAHVLTEGVDWTAATDNATTATSLAAGIDALGNVSCSATAAVSSLVPDDEGLYALELAENDATCTTLAEGSDAPVVFRSNVDMDGHVIYLDRTANANTYIRYGSSTLDLWGNGGQVNIYSTWVRFQTMSLGMNNGHDIYWQGLSRFTSSGNGNWIKTNNAETAGICENFSTDSRLDLYDNDCSTGATFRLMGDKGVATVIDEPKVERLTFAGNPGDASKTTVGTAICDGCNLLFVTTRVITAGTNCTSYSVGVDGGDLDIWGNNIAVADTTTSTTADATAIWANPHLIAQEITLTANGGNCFDLVVDVAAHTMSGTAQTSD